MAFYNIWSKKSTLTGICNSLILELTSIKIVFLNVFFRMLWNRKQDWKIVLMQWLVVHESLLVDA